jgi:hypothetical protein
MEGVQKVQPVENSAGNARIDDGFMPEDTRRHPAFLTDGRLHGYILKGQGLR